MNKTKLFKKNILYNNKKNKEKKSQNPKITTTSNLIYLSLI